METDTGTKWSVEIKDFNEMHEQYTVYNIVSRSGRAQARAQQRFSAFVVLHGEIAPVLGLPLEFPVTKHLLGAMEVVKYERVVRLSRCCSFT